MHPKMMITLAHQVESDREQERHQVRARSAAQSLGSKTASVFGRRPLGRVSLRPRLS
jgi:hypothetical protein